MLKDKDIKKFLINERVKSKKVLRRLEEKYSDIKYFNVKGKTAARIFNENNRIEALEEICIR